MTDQAIDQRIEDLEQQYADGLITRAEMTRLIRHLRAKG